MIKLQSMIRGSWELRNLSILADQATVGLDLHLNGKHNAELIRSGIAFCDAVSSILTLRKPAEQGKMRLQYPRDVTLSEKELVDYLQQKGLTPEAAIRELSATRDFLQRILSEPTQPTEAKFIANVQDQLFFFSSFFFSSDISRLRLVKERRSLKAYG